MKKTLGFQTEVKQLLHLMIHSLYSNKEIFLRELVSNAADAADKLRFEALNKPELFENDPDLKITITAQKEEKTITIEDNGIGMSEDEIIEHLGTIAKSGTKAFFEKLTGDEKKDAHLIGQFGVGFYSSFIISDSVTVESRRAGLPSDKGVRWQSIGDGEFTVETIDKASRGTKIILHLKEDEQEFLSDWTLRRIVTTYSDHISIPIYMKKAPEYDDEGNVKENEELESVNQAQALWTRNKNDITEEQYQEFYKHVSHDFSDALAWSHAKVEGKQEYTELLYIPKRAPFDLYERERQSGIKLYVKRVFIMEDTQKLMPQYLRFVRGIIDSNDLPLNVSREILQGSKDLDTIRSGCVRKVLDLIESLVKNKPEDFKTFWATFGQVLKEGVGEDFSNQARIAKLLRFSSTHNNNDEQNVSLENYISRMQEGQDKIYYITADSYTAAKNSPHLEIFTKKGIEVLLLTDRIDEWVTGSLTQFEEMALVNAAKGDLNLGELDSQEEKKHLDEIAEASKDIISNIKETLADKVEDVRVSTRLTESPACLVVGENDMSAHLARMLEAAGAGAQVPSTKPTLEINPDHFLIKRLQSESETEKKSELIWLLFDQALLAEGGKLDDPAGFVKRINHLLTELK